MNRKPFNLYPDPTGETEIYQVTAQQLKQLRKLAGNSFEITESNPKKDETIIKGKRALLDKYFKYDGTFIGEGQPAKPPQRRIDKWIDKLGAFIRSLFIMFGWIGVLLILGVADVPLRVILLVVYVPILLGVVMAPYLADKLTGLTRASLPSDVEMGRLSLESKDYETAAKCFWRALDDDPGNAHLWYLLGLAKDNGGKADEALKYYDRAIQEGDVSEAWNNKGAILVKLGKRQTAIECFQMAATLGNIEARNNLRKLGVQ